MIHKGRKNTTVLFILGICVIMSICFIVRLKVMEQNQKDEYKEIEYVEAIVDKDTLPGVNGAQIDAVYHDHMVFHDYYGLFIYNFPNRRLRSSLSLASIGCDMTQGDGACEIFFGENNCVLIHPMNSDRMYAFNFVRKTVVEIPYDSTKFIEGEKCVSLSDYIERDLTIFQSDLAFVADIDVVGANDTRKEKALFWLESGSRLPIDLSLHMKIEAQDEGEIIRPLFRLEENQ